VKNRDSALFLFENPRKKRKNRALSLFLEKDEEL